MSGRGQNFNNNNQRNKRPNPEPVEEQVDEAATLEMLRCILATQRESAPTLAAITKICQDQLQHTLRLQDELTAAKEQITALQEQFSEGDNNNRPTAGLSKDQKVTYRCL